jgi:monofunctional glycosyltransferase
MVERMKRGLRGALTGLIGLGLGIGAMLGLGAIYAAVTWLRLPGVERLGAAGDPGPSAYMQRAACEAPARTWRELEALDPALGCAVVWAEDRRFFHHDGVDDRALEAALRRAWRQGRVAGGGSTIPMQLARNLYLSADRTPTRKLTEMVLARRLAGRYERTRLLEVYLNAVEWAPCVYGAEAAARHYFGHGADRLAPAEAAFLAAMLPRPGRRPQRGPDQDQLEYRQQVILTLLVRAGLLQPGRLAADRARVGAMWRHYGTGRFHGLSAPSVASGGSDWYVRLCGSRPDGTLPD